MDKIGVFCPSIFPTRWLNLYESIVSNNDIEIELMFVGHVPPNFALPSRMKYIYSSVKPAQCSYIGATRVDGNYLVLLADDVSISPHTFDSCLEMLKRNDVSRTIVSPRYGRHAMDFYGDGRYHDIVPTMNVCSFMSRELWLSLGIDKNFVALYWDSDQAMKVWSMGGKIEICEAGSLIDVQIPDSIRMANWNDGFDRRLFYSFWTKCPFEKIESYATEQMKTQYPPVLERQRPPEPIVESPDLLTVSQGAKGVWN